MYLSLTCGWATEVIHSAINSGKEVEGAKAAKQSNTGGSLLSWSTLGRRKSLLGLRNKATSSWSLKRQLAPRGESRIRHRLRQIEIQTYLGHPQSNAVATAMSSLQTHSGAFQVTRAAFPFTGQNGPMPVSHFTESESQGC